MGTRTKEFPFSVEEICRIIETCATNQVSVLKFGDLKLEFGKKTELPPESSQYPWRSGEAYPNPVTEMTEHDHERQTQEAVETEEVRLREERLAQMFIENPRRAEELLLDGELEEEDGASDESEDEF